MVFPGVRKRLARDENYVTTLLHDSHRETGGTIQVLLRDTQELLRRLLSIPETHQILFFQGGAHAQFSAIPLNMNARRARFLCSGSWSAKATNEQERYLVAAGGEAERVTWGSCADVLSPSAAAAEDTHDYYYYCTNETMDGIQLTTDDVVVRPTRSNHKEVPLVIDATSDLLSRPMKFENCGVVFASGGKNLGPAGFTAVIVRDDVLKKSRETPHELLPSVLSWAKMYDAGGFTSNIYNTPPALSIGIAKLVLEELSAMGGVEWAEARGKAMSERLYDYLRARHDFYGLPAIPSESFRSRVSLVFRLQPRFSHLESEFHRFAAKEFDLVQLNNHPSVGGFRASLYNGVPDDAVERLIECLEAFREKHSSVPLAPLAPSASP